MSKHESIKYGDVFPVQGDLAAEPIRPRDAALMQTAENKVTGKTVKGQTFRTVREKVAGQTVVTFTVPTEADADGEKITMGEALEAAALSQSDRPVEQSDAAAIQAAEVRSIKVTAAGGVAAAAQSAAETNARIAREEDKITVGDVLNNATVKLAPDKEVTREDAEAVIGAEIRNRRDLRTVAGGVADSVAAAARINEKMSRA